MLFGLDQSADYYVYYRDTEDERASHVVSDGRPICSHSVEVPEDSSLTPIDEISTKEWSSLLNSNSDLCTSCGKLAVRGEIVPEQFVEDEQEKDQIPDDEVRPPVEGFHLYYGKGTALNPNPRDHIVDGGEALCDYGVNVSTADSLKPVENISAGEWSVLLGSSSNLCGDCRKAAEWEGIFPEELVEEPEYECPHCEEPVLEVKLSHVAYIHHGSKAPGRGTVHKAPREHYEEWRRNQ